MAAWLLCEAAVSEAAPVTWSGTAGSGFWSNAGNWGGSSPSNGDDLIFPAGASRLTNTNDFSALKPNSITFTGAGGGYHLYGNALTLTNGLSAQHTTGLDYVHLNFILGAAQTFGVTADHGQLGLEGDVDLNTSDLTADTTGGLRLDGALTGNGSLIKDGEGNFSLSGSNSYSGLTLVRAGVLEVESAYPLGTTNAGTSVSNGAALYLFTLSLSASVTNESLVLNGRRSGTGALYALAPSPTTNCWAGPVRLGSDTAIWPTDREHIRILGPISGSGNLTISTEDMTSDNPSVSFEGPEPNTYSGTTYVEKGALILAKSVANAALPGPLLIGDGVHPATLTLDLMAQIPDSAAVTVNTNARFELNSVSDTVGSITGRGEVTLGSGTLGAGSDDSSFTWDGSISGSGGVTKHGTGTMTLTGTNSYMGTTEVVNGTLLVNGYQPQSPVQVDAVGLRQLCLHEHHRFERLRERLAHGSLRCASRGLPGCL